MNSILTILALVICFNLPLLVFVKIKIWNIENLAYYYTDSKLGAKLNQQRLIFLFFILRRFFFVLIIFTLQHRPLAQVTLTILI